MAPQCEQGTIVGLSSADFGSIGGIGRSNEVVRGAPRHWNLQGEDGGQLFGCNAKVARERVESGLVRVVGRQAHASHRGGHHAIVEGGQLSFQFRKQAHEADLLALEGDDFGMRFQQNVVVLVGDRGNELGERGHLRL